MRTAVRRWIIPQGYGSRYSEIMVETIFLARPRGFCAGVVMAIEAVERAAGENLDRNLGDLAVYHAIVHNDTVLERLEWRHRVRFVEGLEELAGLGERLAAEGGKLSEVVVFSAHGVSPAVRRRAAELSLTTLDATCPLVTKVHSEAKRYAEQGYHILLIGDSSTHQEIIGTRGEAPEVTTLVAVVGSGGGDPGLADPGSVTVPDPERVAVLTQTTLSVDDTMRTIALLKKRFPKLIVPRRDDLCYATKNRQDAVRRIAPLVDLFLVVSSSYSSNGLRLLELARELMGNARRIEGLGDLEESWLAGVRSLGITSAASTPDDLVQELTAFFGRRNPRLQVIEEGEWEDITFRPPRRIPPTAVRD